MIHTATEAARTLMALENPRLDVTVDYVRAVLVDQLHHARDEKARALRSYEAVRPSLADYDPFIDEEPHPVCVAVVAAFKAHDEAKALLAAYDEEQGGSTVEERAG